MNALRRVHAEPRAHERPQRLLPEGVVEHHVARRCEERLGLLPNRATAHEHDAPLEGLPMDASPAVFEGIMESSLERLPLA